MKKIITFVVFILIATTFLAWGRIRVSMAKNETLSITKPTRRYSLWLRDKLNEVLANQQAIMQELDDIKDRLNKLKPTTTKTRTRTR